MICMNCMICMIHGSCYRVGAVHMICVKWHTLFVLDLYYIVPSQHLQTVCYLSEDFLSVDDLPAGDVSEVWDVVAEGMKHATLGQSCT